MHLGVQSAIITLRGREAWYLARPITLRSLVQIQSPQDFLLIPPERAVFYGGISLLGRRAAPARCVCRPPIILDEK